MKSVWRRGSLPRAPSGWKRSFSVLMVIGITLLLVAQYNGEQANASGKTEGVPEADSVSAQDHAHRSALSGVEGRIPGSRARKPLQPGPQIMAGSIAMHPSSSVFVDLVTPDSSYVCSAVRVLPTAISSKQRQLPEVSLPIPLEDSRKRRMQVYGGDALAFRNGGGRSGGQQAPMPPFLYNYYTNYYPAYPSSSSAYEYPESAAVERPFVPSLPQPYYSTSVFPPSRGIPSPSQMVYLPSASPGSYMQPSPQQAYQTQYRVVQDRNIEDPRAWQAPPTPAPPPPATPSPTPSPPWVISPEGTVRHPVTLPVGTTVTAPVTIPITLPITSPSLSPLTIAFPLTIPGERDFFPPPFRPGDPSPSPPTSPAPSPLPLPYYPYPPYYPPSPRPGPPAAPGNPPDYPRPPTQPSPAPPTPPIVTPPYPIYPYPPYFPYPPPQTPAPSPSPAPTPPENGNPPLPSPVPVRPTPTPRRPGRGGGTDSSEYPEDKMELQRNREEESEAIPWSSSDPVSTSAVKDKGVRRPEEAQQQAFPLRAGTAVKDGQLDITAGVVNGVADETIEGQGVLASEQQGAGVEAEVFLDFLGKAVPPALQTVPTIIPTGKDVISADLSSTLRVKETTPSATISKEGININPSAFDQLMAAIVAKIDSRDRSEPLFLPSICPACKVDIVTYAPIQMPEPDVDSFERARDQLTYLQRQRVPNGVQPARGRREQGEDRAATVMASMTVEEELTDQTTNEKEAATLPKSSSSEQATEVHDGEDHDVAGNAPVVLPKITSAFLEALHVAEGNKTQTSEEATKRKAAVVNPDTAPETEDLSSLFSPVNRRRRPKEFRSLSRERDGTAYVRNGNQTVPETYIKGSIRLSATPPLKREEITQGTDDIAAPSVYRSRLDAGDEEGTFAVLFACYRPYEDVEPLLMASLEVRVANEMPLHAQS
ncbi:hypothetical protein TGME49_258910 [Toxoplasma gondii ME49]|uniref:Transmembrane protein n=2 Tax=Toxoplasma gondii TaxID=5811 RepID=A0A125YIX9_TOXGV|nr:hypothetical protein TGME49_258910 [Toxoplasma gondii ME49]EPT29392.1 hypothetical protein TGME49_258910 [Toxoplasma gondii ME49]ESS32246.1 putative transmembrane protein [Toxoplasma gondii VEG]|eukprot:XP_018637033.1 hypothetical protein TGME49_258910 [Toxoplasma gondii ME49]